MIFAILSSFSKSPPDCNNKYRIFYLLQIEMYYKQFLTVNTAPSSVNTKYPVWSGMRSNANIFCKQQFMQCMIYIIYFH